MGAGVSAAAGHVGRAAEADIRAGDRGAATCYTYSCSKGEKKVTSFCFWYLSLITEDSTRSLKLTLKL